MSTFLHCMRHLRITFLLLLKNDGQSNNYKCPDNKDSLWNKNHDVFVINRYLLVLILIITSEFLPIETAEHLWQLFSRLCASKKFPVACLFDYIAISKRPFKIENQMAEKKDEGNIERNATNWNVGGHVSKFRIIRGY